MKRIPHILAVCALLTASAFAEDTDAEVAQKLSNALKDAGGMIGKFGHHREPMPIDSQGVIRANRDTLYSPALIDFEAGPVDRHAARCR